MGKENIEKEAKLEEIKKELEEVKKKLEANKIDEEVESMPVYNVPNFEMFTQDNKLSVIYNELVYIRDNIKLLFEKVKDIQVSVGKPT